MLRSRVEERLPSMSYPTSSPTTHESSGPERFFTTDSQHIARRSARGAVATGIGRMVRFVLRFGSTAILARLLTPADYGLIGMTAVAVGLVGLFSDAGLTSATVQRETITHRQVSTIFWINAAIGISLVIFLALCAPLVAWFYGDPRLVGITALMGVSFVFVGFSIQHQALLRRQMRFGVLALIDGVAALISVITAIIMAVYGAGYWSLVGMTVANAVTYAVGTWIAIPWRPCLPSRGNGVKSMLKFGADILCFDLINYFARSADNMLIGKFYGANPLGIYDKAYSLLILPITQINAPLTSVALPALSRMKDDPSRFGRFLFSALELMASGTLPIVISIALFADDFVLLLLGEAWMESAELFRLLAVAAAIRAVTNPVGWIFISRGDTVRYRRMGVFNSILIVAAFAFGLPWGVKGVAIAYSSAMVMLFFPIWIYALQGTGFSFREVIRCLVPAALSCLIAGVLSYVADRVGLLQGLNEIGRWLETVGVFSLFFGLYGLILLVVMRRWDFFKKVLKELRGK